MISLNSISISYGTESVLKDVSVVVNKGEKVALTGKNGAGKSTLLKIIAGKQNPSEGTVSIQNGIKIGYLPQEMTLVDSTTLIEEVSKIFSDTIELNKKLDDLHKELEQTANFDSGKGNDILEEIDNINSQLSIFSLSNMQAQMEQTLLGLGFTKDDFNRPTSEFSGGWRMRIELAKILLQSPDVLLLDEPTNHLDIESIQWFENFLRNKKISLLLVSHDRAFLDNVTNRTIEINCGRIFDYKVAYTEFLQLRKERLSQQIAAYQNQQKQIAEIQEFIERFRYKATKAVQVQSRIKQLEKIVPIEIDEVDNSTINLRFPPAKRSGDYPLIIENVDKSYGDHLIFKDADFMIKRGEKIAFVGKNGEGKSTMIKCIMNQTEFNGKIQIGHNVEIGYFAQNETQLLDKNITVFDTVDQVATGDVRTRLKDILASFLFRGDDIDKKVGVLSGGEKARLAMIKLLLKPCNLLIMDEPTNHLDIASKEILKNALKQYDGTLILVSHDRDFLDGLVSKVFEFTDRKVKEHPGGIYDFLERKKLLDLNLLGYENSSKELNSGPQAKEAKEGALEYQKQKERDRAKKRIEKQIKRLEEEIETVETDLKIIEEKIGNGDTSPEIFSDYENSKNALSSLMTEWEKLQEEYE